jgi:hypothetical protein
MSNWCDFHQRLLDDAGKDVSFIAGALIVKAVIEGSGPPGQECWACALPVGRFDKCLVEAKEVNDKVDAAGGTYETSSLAISRPTRVP